jgi:hypothetical protein
LANTTRGRTMGKKVMVVLRGLPGSGKSSFAHKLFMRFAGSTSNRGRVALCSADNFFMKEVKPPEVQVGPFTAQVAGRSHCEYQFNPALLGQAYQKCWEDAFKACCDGVPLVIIDNINSERWEYANYEHLAAAKGYAVTIQETGLRPIPIPIPIPADIVVYKYLLQDWFKRQSHGVPLQAFLAMWWRWERDERAKPLTAADTDPEQPLDVEGLTAEDLDG